MTQSESDSAQHTVKSSSSSSHNNNNNNQSVKESVALLLCMEVPLSDDYENASIHSVQVGLENMNKIDEIDEKEVWKKKETEKRK